MSPFDLIYYIIRDFVLLEVALQVLLTLTSRGRRPKLLLTTRTVVINRAYRLKGLDFLIYKILRLKNCLFAGGGFDPPALWL